MTFLFFVDTESNWPFLVVFTIIYDENILGPACFYFGLTPDLKFTFSMSRCDAPKYWFFSLLIVRTWLQILKRCLDSNQSICRKYHGLNLFNRPSSTKLLCWWLESSRVGFILSTVITLSPHSCYPGS